MRKTIDTILWFPANSLNFCSIGYETRGEALMHTDEPDGDDMPFTYAAKVQLTEIPRKRRVK